MPEIRVVKRPLPSNREFYEGQYRMAILNALNVLGIPGPCPNQHCQGCDYERDTAQSILYGALGLELDLREPVSAYEAMMRQFVADRES